MTTNQVLSETLKVAPLKGEEVATFILLSKTIKEKNRDEPSGPKRYKISERQNVTDPYDKNGNTRKTIGNPIGMEQAMEGGRPKVDAQGMPVMIMRYEKPEFVDGIVEVRADENAKYEYFMRRKDNVSNPFRLIMGGKRVRAVFKLMDDKKEVQDLLQHKEIAWVAQKLVREAKLTDLKAIATKMNESPDPRLHIPSLNGGDSQAIKLDMIRMSENYPKFLIAASDDNKSKLKVQIYECISLGILVIDQGTFYLLGKDTKEIHKPAPDKEAVESLMEFFMGDKGREKYLETAEVLRKSLKA